MKFYEWLLAQRERIDNVGRLARYAASERTFPRRSQRLYVFLRYFENASDSWRDAVKQAHREWRRTP